MENNNQNIEKSDTTISTKKADIAAKLFNLPVNLLSNGEIKWILSHIPDEAIKRGENDVTGENSNPFTSFLIQHPINPDFDSVNNLFKNFGVDDLDKSVEEVHQLYHKHNSFTAYVTELLPRVSTKQVMSVFLAFIIRMHNEHTTQHACSTDDALERLVKSSMNPMSLEEKVQSVSHLLKVARQGNIPLPPEVEALIQRLKSFGFDVEAIALNGTSSFPSYEEFKEALDKCTTEQEKLELMARVAKFGKKGLTNE